MKLIRYIVKIFFSLAAMFMLIMSYASCAVFFEDYKTASSMNKWDEAPGIVLSSYIKQNKGRRGRSVWCPIVDYSYKTKSGTYKGKGVMFKTGCAIYKGTAEQMISPYSQGNIVKVFINPNNRSQTALIKGVSSEIWDSLKTAIACGAIFIVCIILVFSRTYTAAQRSHNKSMQPTPYRGG